MLSSVKARNLVRSLRTVSNFHPTESKQHGQTGPLPVVFSLDLPTKNLFSSNFFMFNFCTLVGLAYRTTCRRFTKLRIFNTFDYKYKQNLVSKITNSDKSQTPQFRETAVSSSAL